MRIVGEIILAFTPPTSVVIFWLILVQFHPPTLIKSDSCNNLLDRRRHALQKRDVLDNESHFADVPYTTPNWFTIPLQNVITFFFPSASSKLYGFQSTPCGSFRRWQHGMWDLSLKCEQSDNRGIKDWGQQANVWRSTVSQHMCQLLVQPSGLSASFSATNGQFDLAH